MRQLWGSPWLLAGGAAVSAPRGPGAVCCLQRQRWGSPWPPAGGAAVSVPEALELCATCTNGWAELPRSSHSPSQKQRDQLAEHPHPSTVPPGLREAPVLSFPPGEGAPFMLGAPGTHLGTTALLQGEAAAFGSDAGRACRAGAQGSRQRGWQVPAGLRGTQGTAWARLGAGSGVGRLAPRGCTAHYLLATPTSKTCASTGFHHAEPWALGQDRSDCSETESGAQGRGRPSPAGGAGRQVARRQPVGKPSAACRGRGRRPSAWSICTIPLHTCAPESAFPAPRSVSPTQHTRPECPGSRGH